MRSLRFLALGLGLSACGIELNEDECVRDEDCVNVAAGTVCSQEGWCVRASAPIVEDDANITPPRVDAAGGGGGNPIVDAGAGGAGGEPIVDAGEPIADAGAGGAEADASAPADAAPVDAAPVDAEAPAVDAAPAADGATD